MVETTKLELSVDELKVLLTALHAFELAFNEKESRRDTLLSIYDAEKSYNYDYELEALIADPQKFINTVVSNLSWKVFESFYDLAEKTHVSKPLPPEDERISLEQLRTFFELDIAEGL